MIGTTLRAAIGLRFPAGGENFPWATLGGNVAGAFCLGMLVAVVPGRGAWRCFFGTGLLGSFTSFSAYSLETLALGEAGRPVLAGWYAAGSVGLGLLAALAGVKAGRFGRGAAAGERTP